MSRDLKKLVSELEVLLSERGGSFDAPARAAFESRIESLKQAIDLADATEARRLRVDALELLAALLSVVTNVMSLWR